MLGTWHHGSSDVLSSLSRDPQPKINVSRDSDADLLPLPASSSEGVVGGGWRRAGSQHSPGRCCGRGRHQGGDPRPWRSQAAFGAVVNSTMEQPVCPLLSPCLQCAELALPPVADQDSSQAVPRHREERSPAAGRGTLKQIRAELLKSASQLFASTYFCRGNLLTTLVFLSCLSDEIAALCKGMLAPNRCLFALACSRH